MKLTLKDVKLENGKITIGSAEITQDWTTRKAEMNDNLVNLIASLEIDISRFAQYNAMRKRNPGLQYLVDKFDLTLI